MASFAVDGGALHGPKVISHCGVSASHAVRVRCLLANAMPPVIRGPLQKHENDDTSRSRSYARAVGCEAVLLSVRNTKGGKPKLPPRRCPYLRTKPAVARKPEGLPQRWPVETASEDFGAKPPRARALQGPVFSGLPGFYRGGDRCRNP